MKNLIKYVIAERKIIPEENIERFWKYQPWGYLPKNLTEADLHHLLAESVDKRLWEDFKNFKGTLAEFIQSQSTVNQKVDALVIKNNIRARSINGYIKTFEENEKTRMHQRANSVKAYHTILSFSHLDGKFITDRILKDIAQEYISVRGPTSLFLGAVHRDRDHLHIHMIQSGVQCGTGLASRISQETFREIKRTMQEYQKDKYPSLIHSLPDHGRKKQLQKESINDGKKIKPNERESDKKYLIEVLQATLSEKKCKQEFLDSLSKYNCQPYFRNEKLQGILFEGRKFRFSNLGYKQEVDRVELTHDRQERELQELSRLRQGRNSRITELSKPNPDDILNRLRDLNSKAKDSEKTNSVLMHIEMVDSKNNKEVFSFDELENGHRARVLDKETTIEKCEKEPPYYTNNRFDFEKWEEYVRSETLEAELKEPGPAEDVPSTMDSSQDLDTEDKSTVADEKEQDEESDIQDDKENDGRDEDNDRDMDI